MPASTLEIAVAYHDARPHPLPGEQPFTAVCNVGRGGSRPPGFSSYDDQGGFPDRNQMYGELSALRWLQTNSEAEILGLAHYRRVWTCRRHLRTYAPGVYELKTWDWSQLPRHRATTDDLLIAMRGASWCSAPVYDVRWAGHDTLAQQFAAHHDADIMAAAVEAAGEVTPSWPSLGDYLAGSTRLRPFNMLLARRAPLEDYLRWLWPVLEATVRHVGIPDDAYQARYPGFVAERLHGYWLECAPPARHLQVGEIGLAVVAADRIVNSAAPGGLAARPVDRPPVAATDRLSSVARCLPFPLRTSAVRTARLVRTKA